jgi:hypothetical protein
MKATWPYKSQVRTSPPNSVDSCRRRRAGLPPLSDTELARAIQKLTFGAAVLDIVPSRMSLSTSDAFRTAQQRSEEFSVRYASRYEMSPEKAELARRHLALNLRVAAYGTMATALALGGVVTAVAWQLDLRSWEDCRRGLHAWGRSCRPWLQDAMRPWRETAVEWVRCVRPGN